MRGPEPQTWREIQEIQRERDGLPFLPRIMEMQINGSSQEENDLWNRVGNKRW